MSAPTEHRRIAVIGSGVAGLAAAYVAAKSAHVTLFEAEERLGGHVDTHVVDAPDGPHHIDTGFIVHNERTYPTLLRLFDELGVRTQDSEMSMSVRDDGTGLEWAGALGLRGLFASRRSASPSFLRMLGEVSRFHRRAKALLAAEPVSVADASPQQEWTVDDQTLREFLAAGGFSDYFRRHFAEPLVAAVWSCDPARALDYPARYLFAFLQHHGMLGVFGSPQWKTVVGGAREYVDRIAAVLPDVRTGTKVTSVLELGSEVVVTDGNGLQSRFDAVVIATHPDQALSMLAEPTRAQRDVLSTLPYTRNTARLHTDESILPRSSGARSSWNFLRPEATTDGTGAVTVTYDLTRLMRLPTSTRYLVTLGGGDLVDPDTVLDVMEYAHPLYTPESVAARSRLAECDTPRISFAGAYHGWGFHEDGAAAGVAAAARLGMEWDRDRPAPRRPRTGLYRTTIRHLRRTPWRRSFEHRSYTWLVDLDDLPDHGWYGRFEARDHIGDPDASIRQNIDRYLSSNGIDLGGGRILMAAHARGFGYCFNPISTYWCFAPDNTLVCTIVEVHNTYGDRHAYLVHPDAQGRARTDKAMYVSPFHGTDGRYELSVPVPGDRLVVGVSLHSDDGAVFSASLQGTRVTDRTASARRRAGLAALRTSALIRLHGSRLWLRRLPIRPRPTHHQEHR